VSGNRIALHPHARIGFIPDTQVLQFGENAFARGDKLFGVSPVHADESDRAIPAPIGRRAKGVFQESPEL
jgi:hypothetical protein